MLVEASELAQDGRSVRLAEQNPPESARVQIDGRQGSATPLAAALGEEGVGRPGRSTGGSKAGRDLFEPPGRSSGTDSRAQFRVDLRRERDQPRDLLSVLSDHELLAGLDTIEIAAQVLTQLSNSHLHRHCASQCSTFHFHDRAYSPTSRVTVSI